MNEIFEELHDAAWNVLHDHPGCGLTAWKDLLLIEYPTEALDALSGDEKAVSEALDKLWQERYADKLTGIEKSFADWAAFFSSQDTAGTYDRLVQNG